VAAFGEAVMRRRYANPPVVEALCELYTSGSAWDATIPGLFYEKVRDHFPKRGQSQPVASETALRDPALAARILSPEPRSQFQREDGTRMIQVAPELVVVNQLRPYPAFEDWRPQIVEVLDLYRELARPTRLERIGLRYINRVVIPEPRFPMERYFAVYPEIPESLGREHGPFLLRIQLLPAVPDHQLIVTFGTAPVERADRHAFVLDLYDTVVEQDFRALERRVDEAHAHLERAFECMITDEARRFFEEGSSAGGSETGRAL
jgi:uncharacterized protein (TIGR04255 family)